MAYLGSIMCRYVWADVANSCSFHSRHHCLYDSVIKDDGDLMERSTYEISASGESLTTLLHYVPLVIVSLGLITSAKQSLIGSCPKAN
jgi:hypothetical protein